MSRIEDPTTEPAYIAEELTRVGDHVHQLLRLQAALRRRRNQHRSLIYILPPELLEVIFLLMCSSERASWRKFGDPTSQVIVLSSVSSHWRQVALSTPSLWETARLVVRKCTSESKAALLQHHLDRARNLALLMDLDGCDRIVPREQYRSISNILFAPQNACKITTLHVINPFAEWLVQLSKLPRIETLVLENLWQESETPLTLDLHTQPLRRLYLSSSDYQDPWGHFNLPSSVQVLKTFDVSHDMVSSFLYQCPKLTEVRNMESLNPFSGFPTSLTLGHLETLVWPAGVFRDHSDHNLSLPVLKHLRLDHHDGDNHPTIHIIAFCHRFSETLRSLELGEFSGWKASDLNSLFLHKLSHLEELKLVNWSIGGVVLAIEALTPSDEDFRCHEIKALPHLQSLALTGGVVYESNDYSFDDGHLYLRDFKVTQMTEACLKMLEKRRAGRLIPFYLTCWKHSWSAELLQKFRQAKRDTWIEVREESEVMDLDWLVF